MARCSNEQSMSVKAPAKSILSGCAAGDPGLVSCLLLVVLIAPPADRPRRAAELDNASVKAERYRREGLALLEQRKMNEALARFRSAVEVDPADAVSHDYIGVILSDQGLTAGAIAEFQRAIEIDANLYRAHYHLAVAYGQTGHTAEAIEEYQRALRLKPDLIEARYGLSAACWKWGDLDGAIRLLQEIVAANPQFGEARYNLGVALWQRYHNTGKLPQKTDLDEAILQLRAAAQQQH